MKWLFGDVGAIVVLLSFLFVQIVLLFKKGRIVRICFKLLPMLMVFYIGSASLFKDDWADKQLVPLLALFILVLGVVLTLLKLSLIEALRKVKNRLANLSLGVK